VPGSDDGGKPLLKDIREHGASLSVSGDLCLTVLQDTVRLVDFRDVDTVVLACQGTLVDWTPAIESVAYELARHNGESPLDRGASLRRRVEALAGEGLAGAFESLAAERGYHGEESGEESLARVVFLTRAYADAVAAVSLAAGSGRRLLALSRTDRRLAAGVLGQFGDVFDAIVDPAELPGGSRVLVVSGSDASLRRASALGARTAWLNRSGRPSLGYECEWRSLDQLPRALGMAASVAA
jgi:FMN phosphatase YigB (HAD superfamily)